MESGADSTTHCVQAEGNTHPQHRVKHGDILTLGFCATGGNSQFNFLELSQSQDLGDEVTNCQEEEVKITPQPDSEKHINTGFYKHILLSVIMSPCRRL